MLSRKLVALLVALVALCVSSGQSERTNARDGTTSEEANELAGLRSRHNNRLLAVPYSLARFLSYNARNGGGGGGGVGAVAERAGPTAELAAGRQIAGYKRSSSALDALTGVTLGKRSANPLEFVNFEPVFGRQSFARGPARVYDTRWAPFDSIETPSGYADYGNYDN